MDVLFLDANVLFSAAYRPDAGLRRLWTLEDVRLITSAYAAEEARRNLSEADQLGRLSELLSGVDMVPSISGRPLPADVTLPSKDHPILLAALSARASHLITGDTTHFGSLYGDEVEGMLIQRPADYLR